ncbi:hypothetical protein C8F04DRAFT_1390618 [Mycena alexandri]|uniref:Transcription factor tau subunit sfc3/Tfc3 C-terminal domain-containing protein n=1 Tax=Mycena alexandri TaxID=1745969 RepID=A0AAD6XBV0_9AGAR|nr:hypothetical protein C8F04DRAFT_1390618 [Mycena alexandri]
MDELLQHVLRELSFDGDLGCNVSRLRDFVIDFYAHSTNTGAQNPDDAFCAFVWSLVVQQPTVIVGTVPEGVTTEVWIAPQNSAKKKAKAKGEELVEVVPAKLDVVPDAKNRSLDDLRQEYGDNLRLAANPEATYAAITGTHIRFPKMSPMVYSALQIITRGRDTGVSVVELGQKSKYDQKTCFYLVRQLTELDLVVKVRRGGVGSHFCIHKYFFDRSESWKAIREEETRAAAEARPQASPSAVVQEEDGIVPEPAGLHFSPIDARHLSSMPLVKARIIKLLKASKNSMHASNNMLIAIGFAHPTKTDRRFFASRTRELVEQRIIEHVFVPVKSRKGTLTSGVRCFRLVAAADETATDVVVVQPDDDPSAEEQSAVKMNLTIHKQIISLIEESGTTGMTLNELTAALCQFDRRTIELLLTRAEKFPPPAHLSDLGIAGLMETSGRERRNRYFTIASYKALVAQENLDKTSAGYTDVDLSDVGGFFPFPPEAFYKDLKALVSHQDRDARLTRAPQKSKPKPRKNPLLADGTVKKGRPRKIRADGTEFKPRKPRKPKVESEAGPSEPKKAPRKRKAEDDATAGPSEAKKAPPAKKRRLNAKQDPADDAIVIGPNGDAPADAVPVPAPEDAPPPKNRGRPSKSASDDAPTVPKKRGRAKKAAVNDDADLDPAAESDGPSKRARLKSPAPPAPDTPPADNIPPVTTLPAQSSPSTHQSWGSSPLTVLDELEDDVEDKPAAEIPEDETAAEFPDDPTNPAPFTLLTFPVLDDSPNLDIPHTPSDSVPLPFPIDPALSDAPRPALPQRSSSLFAVDTPAIKQPKVNVSTLRRENELYRVLQELGGILNTQTKDVFDAHQALLTTLAQAGEMTSAPAGTRLDRRTATTAFNNMELRGKVKQLKTTISSITGLTRSANLVYLPDTEEAKLTAFLAESGRTTVQFPPYVPNSIVVEEHTEFGSKIVRSNRRAKGLAAAQLLQLRPRDSGKGRVPNPTRADELFSLDEETIRDVLLTERTTLGQMYGYIVGKLIRVRELHLHTLNVFDAAFACETVVSHEKRIACFPFFYNDVPIALYCALVPAIEGSDDLSRLLATEAGRNTLARNVPSTLHSLIQIGRTRGRGRILELLDILRSLGLAIPLEPAGSDPAFVTCAPNGNFPTSFKEITTDGWGVNVNIPAPHYWHFTSNAPVFHFAESEANPRLLRRMPLTTSTEASEYWDYLRAACCDTELSSTENLEATPQDAIMAKKKAKTIRRRVSWTDGYSFTWHQTYYLNRQIHGSVGHPGLLPTGASDEQVRRLCYIVSAPEPAVREFLQSAQVSKAEELEKATHRIQRELRDKEIDEETKASLAVKAAEARANREAKWEGLVQKVHPEPLGDAAAIRLRRVRTLFLQATGTQTAKWEREITQAVHEADMATAVNALSTKRFRWKDKPKLKPVAPPAPVGPREPPPAPPIVSNPVEKPIASLIASQDPLVIEKTRRSKQKAAPSEETPPDAPPIENPGPRLRFHWNKDYEELAKDAFTVIHSRCRTRGKVDYGAIKQVFPGVNKANVRSHMKALRENPTTAAYLTRLEDHWHELWMKYRGSEFLPDPDPLSLKFDLIVHIEFLRKHIDKNALRVGFVEEAQKVKNIIPASVEELLDQFDVVDPPGGTPTWDFMWSGFVDENREKRALRQAFTTRPDELVLGTENSSDGVLLAESVLKMAMGTAQDSYDAADASRALHVLGDQAVKPAQKNLLSRGVLSKRFKIPNSRPGRQLKISEGNQNAIGGSIPHDTFQDAAALEDISVDDQAWREWPLLSTDGDTAALIQLVSDNKVDFKIDTSQAQAARVAIDWNSKKTDDDHIETSILVRFHDISIPQTPTPAPTVALPPMEVETVAEHGMTEDGSPACCKRVNEDSLIDCAACLEEEWGTLYASIGSKDRDQFQLILDTVTESGAKGITTRDLLTKTKLPNDAVVAAVRQITECAVPPIFWAGYSALVLVASSYLRAWTVQISAEPMARIFPRRWIDMTGAKVMDLWDAATRAVMGVLVFHPGVTQAQLRWRLRSVYDRQEVNEVVRYLRDAGFVAVRGGATAGGGRGDSLVVCGRTTLVSSVE